MTGGHATAASVDSRAVSTPVRLDSLTGLRLLAALAVFGSHLPRPEGLPTIVATFVESGYNGVTLFFVLSGFVLTYTYADRLAVPDRRSLWDFAVARVARVAPLYLTALLFVVLWVRGDLSPGAWMHLLALQAWSSDMGVVFGLNPPGWSVGVEAFLYATFPLVLFLMVRLSVRRIVWVLVGAVVVLVGTTAAVCAMGGGDLPWSDPWSDHRLLYRIPLTRLPDFVIGVAIALLVMRRRDPSRWAPLVQWASAAVVVVLMCSDVMLLSVLSWDVGYALPFAAFIWSLASSPRAPLARLLARPLIVRGGLVSYALYLFHWPLIQICGIDTMSVGSWLATSAVAFAVALLVATGAHLAIEVPAQRWIRSRFTTSKTPDLPLVEEGRGANGAPVSQ